MAKIQPCVVGPGTGRPGAGPVRYHRARDETDMNVLTMELARIVHEAIEPDGVRAWLRK